MEPDENKDIEELVFEVLERILMLPMGKIKLTDHLIRDLKMDSDDASFDFALGLERMLGIRIPVEEWSKVCTVQETIDLLKKYRSY
jgi:acyl carrier protein